MNDVAERNLTEYLKQVIAMESNVYRQEKSVAQAKKSLVRKEPQKPNLNKPKAPEQLSTFDEELKKNYHNDLKKVKTNRKLYLGGTILFFVTNFGCMIFLLSEILILPLVILFLICGIWFAKEASKLSKVEKNMPLEYQEKQKEFEEQRKKENKEKEIEYKRELEEYEKAMKLGMEDYNKNLAVVQNKYQIAENVIAEMENTLEQSKNVLNELYALDYIFPKYRNFVAVCSFYEYFMSGRCVELAGANGAYNLFEAELRQNLIIAKLDTTNWFFRYVTYKNQNPDFYPYVPKST